MNIVKNLGKEMDKLLKHKNLKLVLILMVTIYSALLAPALPNSIIKFFDTILGKLLFVFLIGYMASKNIQVALIVSIGFIVTLQIIERRKIENYINFAEGFEDDQEDDNADDDGEGKEKTCLETISKIVSHVKKAHHACGSGKTSEPEGTSDTENFSIF